MFSPSALTFYALMLLALPLFVGAGLGLSLLMRIRPDERTVKRLSAFHYIIAVVLVSLLLWGMEQRNFAPLQHLSLFSNILHRYGIDFALFIDRFSLFYLLLSSILMGLIGRFSFFYLHREVGFFRFFVLLHFFSLGLYLIVMAGSLNVLFIGWELVGLTSILLIAFFQERKGPVQSGLYVFLVYRVGDLALLALCVWLHHRFGSTHFQEFLAPDKIASLAQGGAFSAVLWVSLLVVLAAVVKASLFPFLNWLPRAMEGPTPSSAIFYGALSTHMGIFLLIRMHPLLEKSAIISVLLIGLGVISAVLASLVGRIQADAKNSLAYATIVQLGLMLIEVGMGWIWIAQIHLLGHSVLRAFQFLKTPSLLHTHHEMVSLYGRDFSPTGVHLEYLFPERVRVWLYHVAMEGGFLEVFAQRVLIRPILRLAAYLNQVEDRWMDLLSGPPSGASTTSSDKRTAPQDDSQHFQKTATSTVRDLNPKESHQ